MQNSLPAFAETQSASADARPTIGDLRKRRFQDCTANAARVAEYLEQLSAQTGTNIDSWTLDAFASIDPKDRRAINRVFFARKQEKMDGVEALTVEMESAIADAAVRSRELLDSRKRELSLSHTTYLKEAERMGKSAQDYIKTAWNARKELYALEERGADYITADLKKLLQEGFWEFKKYNKGVLTLVTKNNVVMSERNVSAGIDHSVNLGRYQARLDVRQMLLTLNRFEKNALAYNFWHPYVSSSGVICWGNAANTAAKMLSQGEVYNVLCLLASLLVTYSPDANPYTCLADFVRCKKRLDADQNWNDFDDEGRELCKECRSLLDACECCKKCKRHDDRCLCCGHCGEIKSTCECCQSCGKKPTECDACPNCSQHGGLCGCCSQCYRNKAILRSRGHRDGCSRRRKPADTLGASFAVNPFNVSGVEHTRESSPLSQSLPPGATAAEEEIEEEDEVLEGEHEISDEDEEEHDEHEEEQESDDITF